MHLSHFKIIIVFVIFIFFYEIKQINQFWNIRFYGLFDDTHFLIFGDKLNEFEIKKGMREKESEREHTYDLVW